MGVVSDKLADVLKTDEQTEEKEVEKQPVDSSPLPSWEDLSLEEKNKSDPRLILAVFGMVGLIATVIILLASY